MDIPDKITSQLNSVESALSFTKARSHQSQQISLTHRQAIVLCPANTNIIVCKNTPAAMQFQYFKNSSLKTSDEIEFDTLRPYYVCDLKNCLCTKRTVNVETSLCWCRGPRVGWKSEPPRSGGEWGRGDNVQCQHSNNAGNMDKSVASYCWETLFGVLGLHG